MKGVGKGDDFQSIKCFPLNLAVSQTHSVSHQLWWSLEHAIRSSISHLIFDRFIPFTTKFDFRLD